MKARLLGSVLLSGLWLATARGMDTVHFSVQEKKALLPLFYKQESVEKLIKNNFKDTPKSLTTALQQLNEHELASNFPITLFSKYAYRWTHPAPYPFLKKYIATDKLLINFEQHSIELYDKNSIKKKSGQQPSRILTLPDEILIKKMTIDRDGDYCALPIKKQFCLFLDLKKIDITLSPTEFEKTCFLLPTEQEVYDLCIAKSYTGIHLFVVPDNLLYKKNNNGWSSKKISFDFLVPETLSFDSYGRALIVQQKTGLRYKATQYHILDEPLIVTFLQQLTSGTSYDTNDYTIEKKHYAIKLDTTKKIKLDRAHSIVFDAFHIPYYLKNGTVALANKNIATFYLPCEHAESEEYLEHYALALPKDETIQSIAGDTSGKHYALHATKKSSTTKEEHMIYIINDIDLSNDNLFLYKKPSLHVPDVKALVFSDDGSHLFILTQNTLILHNLQDATTKTIIAHNN